MLIQRGKLFLPPPEPSRPQPRLRIQEHQHEESEQEDEKDERSNFVHVSQIAILPFNAQIQQVSSFRLPWTPLTTIGLALFLVFRRGAGNLGYEIRIPGVWDLEFLE